jgi:hypothetical protein
LTKITKKWRRRQKKITVDMLTKISLRFKSKKKTLEMDSSALLFHNDDDDDDDGCNRKRERGRAILV